MNTALNDSQAFVVLGASGGIGGAVATRLADQGCKVMLAARESERLSDLAKDLNAPRFSLDATNVEEVTKCFSAAVDEFGSISGAVNCVGSLLLKPAHLTSEADWQETIAKNLTSAFATVRAAAKTMLDAGGSVVLMSSAAGRVGLANHEAIAAAKAGVIGLTQAAAATYAGQTLRFNAVAPGLVKTGMTRKIWESERASANSTAMHAVGRLGEPEDIASMILWLLDPANSWVTGEVFSVDGGLSNVKLINRP